MRAKYTEFLIIVSTAVWVAFLVNVEAGIFTTYAVNLFPDWLRIVAAVLVLLAILLLVLFLWRLLIPKKIEQKVVFSIFYNMAKGEVIPFPFEEAFFPQDSARQVLNPLAGKNPKYKDALKENLAERHNHYYEKRRRGEKLQESDRHLLGYFVEYLLLNWTKGWLDHFIQAERNGVIRTKKVTDQELPESLKRNPVLSFSSTLGPQGEFWLPADFQLKHIWPMNDPNRMFQYPDSGVLRMRNKYVTVDLTFPGRYVWNQAGVFRSGAMPLFAGIPVSAYYISYFNELPDLYRAAYAVELKAEFSVLYQMFSRTGKAYFEILEQIAKAFKDDFDESQYMARAMSARQERMQERILDSLSEIASLLKQDQ